MLYDRITGFLGFIHRPEFSILGNTTFRKMYLFLSSGEGNETPTLLYPLERANLIPVIEVRAQQSRCLPQVI
jgi:hypothetical protein